MKHFKLPTFPNKDHFLIHGPEFDPYLTTDEEAMKKIAAEEFARDRLFQVLRFNPYDLSRDDTSDVRDVTLDFIPDRPGLYDPFDLVHCERDRSHLVTSVPQYNYEANRRG